MVNKYIVDTELGKQEKLEKDLEAEYTTLKNQLSKKQDQLTEAKTQLEDLKDQLEKKKEQLDEQFGEFNYNDFLQFQKDLGEEIEEIKKSIEELENSSDEESSTGSEGENESDPDEENEGEDGDISENEDDNGNDGDGSEKTLEELKEELQTKEDEYSQNAIRIGDFEELEKSIEELQGTIDELNKQIGKLNDEIPSIKKERDKKKELADAATEQVADLKDKSDSLKTYINDPGLSARSGLYVLSSTNPSKVNKRLEEIFKLTREKYEDNTIFVSVHCNSTGENTTKSSGVQVYYRPNKSSAYKSYPNYYKGYNDAKRKKLAQSMLKNTRENTNFKGSWRNPIAQDFHVLREQNLPSVLMEIGFINNPDDRKLLQQKQTRENAAKGMYLGIVEYFK